MPSSKFWYLYCLCLTPYAATRHDDDCDDETCIDFGCFFVLIGMNFIDDPVFSECGSFIRDFGIEENFAFMRNLSTSALRIRQHEFDDVRRSSGIYERQYIDCGRDLSGWLFQ